MSALRRAIEKSIRRNKRRRERLAHKASQPPASAEYTDNGRGERSQPSRPDGEEPSAAPIKRLEAALATNQPTGT